MRNLVIGILAHVDAGKTTLSESMLYLGGHIRKLGRVDHGDAFLDNNELERNRGITIFSKQAVLDLPDTRVTLLDTPGHVDFSAEMERTLQVLDYAILVINGADGVQSHTKTLWELLRQYQIPVFLFINKMDQPGTDREKLLADLRERLDDGCMPFDQEMDGDFYENVAMCDEQVLEQYLETGEIEKDTLKQLIKKRKVFPCYFGSALKVQGVEEFLEGISEYSILKKQSPGFGAKVYKITRDGQGNRLTHLKVIGGTLKVKDVLGNQKDSENHWEEKVNQIRIYSGEKFEAVQEVTTGSICAVTGLNHTYPGEGLGIEEDSAAPVLEPVLNYQICLPEGCDAHVMIKNLRQLEEEDPMLRIVWKEELSEIHAQLMGEVQIEILQSLIQERFGIPVTFGSGSIVYKETITNVVEGVGHYEPLRHYSEVHLQMEPLSQGSGLVFELNCSEEMLDKNWQRLILTHLYEKVHKGVLTGSAITDMRISLVAGRAHLKHTEGGDFRQSTYRAVRQGLMQAECVLLEPFYEFRLEVPQTAVGRALNDIQRMSGEFDPPEIVGDMSVLVGSAPVSEMREYQRTVAEYTKGEGRLSLRLKGYFPCHNAEEVIEQIGYDAEADLDNPTGSVFCTHGAGFHVPWNQVYQYMHIESQLQKAKSKEEAMRKAEEIAQQARRRREQMATAMDEELEEIFIRTYGKIERKVDNLPKKVTAGVATKAPKKVQPITEYLLVDGYNVIHAWEELKELAKINLEGAKGRLLDILCNYQGFKKCVVIVVFDAYKVEGQGIGVEKYHNIHVVHTKEAETADQYIEKVVQEIGKKYHVSVVTSDRLEQFIIRGQGATLISSREFLEEIEHTNKLIREEYESRRVGGKNYLFDHMDEELAKEMEEVRLGKSRK